MKNKMRSLLLFITAIFFTLPVRADTVADFCKDIENTNDLVACLSKYNDKTKDELAANFQSTFKSLSPEAAAELKVTQQRWIDYRNSECEWEVKSEKNESLKRLRELHCMIRMTADRQATIDGYGLKLQDHNRAQGVKPRWENVLYTEYSDVYWRAGKMKVTDLNCDGQLENTLLGINIDNNNNTEFMVAFIESPHTGKPVPLLMDLPSTSVDPISGEEILCGQDIVFMAPDPIGVEGCQPGEMNIKNGQCGMYYISNTDKGFSIDKKGAVQEEGAEPNETKGH